MYYRGRTHMDCMPLRNWYSQAGTVSRVLYAAIVWDNSTQELSDLIKSVQHRAGKIISLATNQISQVLVHKELGWISIN